MGGEVCSHPVMPSKEPTVQQLDGLSGVMAASTGRGLNADFDATHESGIRQNRPQQSADWIRKCVIEEIFKLGMSQDWKQLRKQTECAGPDPDVVGCRLLHWRNRRVRTTGNNRLQNRVSINRMTLLVIRWPERQSTRPHRGRRHRRSVFRAAWRVPTTQAVRYQAGNWSAFVEGISSGFQVVET